METDSTEHMTTTLEYLSNPVYHAEVFQTKQKHNEANDTIPIMISNFIVSVSVR